MNTSRHSTDSGTTKTTSQSCFLNAFDKTISGDVHNPEREQQKAQTVRLVFETVSMNYISHSTGSGTRYTKHVCIPPCVLNML